MSTPENRGRARQLIEDGPNGGVSHATAILWLVKVAYFLLARYVVGD